MLGLSFLPVLDAAAIQGPCVDCHTMHNSQNNSPMNYANIWDVQATPNEQLLRASCLGCHAMGAGTGAIYSTGSDSIPQVFHDDSVDLAGGNFGYITGIVGSGASDAKGHNIVALTGADGDLYAPPGGIVQIFHDDGVNVNTNTLTCAGTNGCHGNRLAALSGDPEYEGITGAHHNNATGAVNPNSPTVSKEPGQSYRFLLGVVGYEDPDWEFDIAGHNEYYALTAPVMLDCSLAGCHLDGGVRPPDGTMSQYCATCHGNFHTLETSSSDGVGLAATSPFIRHPTDLALPGGTTEYASYTTYNLQAPIARTTPPAVVSNTVTADGNTDAVMCLSCHRSHASDFADMLRWDYSTMITGSGAGTGCFVCHTTKD